MRRVARALVVAMLTLVAAVLMAISQTMTSLVALTATYFAMGGTNHPLSIPPDTQPFVSSYVGGTYQKYVQPSGLCNPSGCTNQAAVVTPEQFFPVYGSMTFDQSVKKGQTNLDSCLHGSSSCVWTDPATGVTYFNGNTPPAGPYVVLGYSQSATVATLEKRALAANDPTAPVSFILIANPDRPNGGILERFNFGNSQPTIPFLGITFYGATPTDTNFPTVDVARQYDAISDFPTNPLNLLADANAAAGYYYLHGNPTPPGDPLLQGQYGDTTYYMFMSYPLPILTPLESIPFAGPITVDMIDPVMRVLVESAYDRTTNPGVPSTANFLYFGNPVQLGTGLVMAVPTGLLLGFQDITGARVPGTAPDYLTGPNATYYVGGPPVNAGCGTPPCGAPTPAATTNPQAQTVSNTTTTTQPAPMILSLISTPQGLLALLVNPMKLMTSLATFSNLVGVINGGGSLGNPFAAIGGPGAASGAGISPLANHTLVAGGTTGGTTGAPKVLATADATDGSSAPSHDPIPGTWARHDTASVAQQNDASTNQTQPTDNTAQGTTNAAQPKGPLLNVVTQPFLPKAGSPSNQSATDATKPSQPQLQNPIGSGLSQVANSVTSSIKSALGGPSSKNSKGG